MALFKHDKIKSAFKAIHSIQKNGITAGDSCPRCGAMTMDENSVYLKNEGVYVCSQCSLELSLSAFLGDDDYNDWAAVAGIRDNKDWQPVNAKIRIPVPKFEVEDHVIDAVSDSPCVVKEVLPNGLYLVHLDGEDSDETNILKDREMLFDVLDIPDVYSRFHEGEQITVYRALGVTDVKMPPREGVILESTRQGQLKVQLKDGLIANIAIDTDLFQKYEEVTNPKVYTL